jgi:hypothetical protein
MPEVFLKMLHASVSTLPWLVFPLAQQRLGEAKVGHVVTERVLTEHPSSISKISVERRLWISVAAWLPTSPHGLTAPDRSVMSCASSSGAAR